MPAQCVLLAVCAQCAPNIHRTYSVVPPSEVAGPMRTVFAIYIIFFSLFSRGFFSRSWAINEKFDEREETTATTTTATATKSETIHFEWRAHMRPNTERCVWFDQLVEMHLKIYRPAISNVRIKSSRAIRERYLYYYYCYGEFIYSRPFSTNFKWSLSIWPYGHSKYSLNRSLSTLLKLK